ncbi:hypothetical protein IIC38_00130 [candidate division KSB1 bacterium]|nr:hypothetical protein [candidate division KSB1 bacterium]
MSTLKKKDWNELEFLSWKEFQQMGPAIIQLEISRISKLTNQFTPETDFYNSLVKARFELKNFVNCVKETKHGPLPDSSTDHLRNAIMSISLGESNQDQKANQTLNYILTRLNYVYNRIGFVY